MKSLLAVVLLLPILVACQSESLNVYKKPETKLPGGLSESELTIDIKSTEPEVKWSSIKSIPDEELPGLLGAPDLKGALFGKVDIVDKQFVPKVDIVVVIDDSASMRRHIANLKRSIQAFVNALNKNDLIDFHVAVLPAWDGKRYGTKVKIPNYTPLGEFVRLVLPGKTRSETPSDEVRFISKDTPNYVEVIRESLALEAKVFCCSQQELKDLAARGESIDHNSPQFEEFFPQVVEALTNEMLNNSKAGFNRGFRRDGEHLSLVFFTDSDNHSESSTNAKSFASFLKTYTGDHDQSGLKLSTFAALHPTSRADTASCPKDFDQKNAFEIEELVNLTNPTSIKNGRHTHIMDICSQGNFSSSLSQMGEKLREQTLAGHEVIFSMAALPANYKMTLCFGFESEIQKAASDVGQPVCGQSGVVVPELKSDQAGWAYNSQRGQVVLRGYHSLKRPEGAELFWRLQLVQN